jgi:hypothetical protein
LVVRTEQANSWQRNCAPRADLFLPLVDLHLLLGGGRRQWELPYVLGWWCCRCTTCRPGAICLHSGCMKLRGIRVVQDPSGLGKLRCAARTVLLRVVLDGGEEGTVACRTRWQVPAALERCRRGPTTIERAIYRPHFADLMRVNLDSVAGGRG